MTKAELEKLHKKLKGEFKDYKKEVEAANKELKKEVAVLSKQEIDLEALPYNAVSVVKLDGEFKLVKLKFSLDTKEASVVELVNAGKNTKSYDIAAQEAKKYLVLEIMKKI